MTDFLQFAVLGLGVGAAYALLAQGVVVIQQGSGVLNFAHGAMAMVGAFLCWQLHDQQGWAYLPSLAVSVVGVAVLGAVVHQGVMRPLRTASSLTRVIASLGVLLTLQAGAQLIWGAESRFVPSSLPSGTFEIAGVTVGYDRPILLGIAIGLSALLWLAYRHTSVGLATVAVAENRRAGAALGWSPDALATLNWALGAGLAALAGILIAPLSGLQVTSMTMLVLPALAAALIGGFASFPLTLAGAVLLGVAQTEAGQYVTQQGVPQSLPFLVIVVVLVLRGKGLPVRGFVGERMPALGSGVPRPGVIVAVTALFGALIVAVFPGELVAATTISLTFAIVMLSVVVLTGYAGQLSLAPLALGGLGAFFAGRLVATAGWPFELALLAGVLGAVPVGLLFAVPAIRTRGVNLAVVTLGLGMAVQAVIFANASYTGGVDGTTVGPQSFAGVSVDALSHPRRYCLLVLAFYVLCALMLASVRRGRAGRRLIAVRANERAAAALGVSVVGSKLYAFALSAGFAGLGGVLLGFQSHTILYDTYDPLLSILVVAFAVIGGVGYVIGPLLGAMLVAGGIGTWISDTLLASIDKYAQLIGGVTLILLLIKDPDGMASAIPRPVRRLLRRARAASLPRLEGTSAHRVAPAALEVSGLTVRFGGVTAVDGVSLGVQPGQVVGLIGPNGAGKTTVIDAVSGFVRPAEGSVTVNGRAIERRSVAARARAGVSRSFQGLELFEDVTVLENLRAASDERDRGAYLTDLVAPRNRDLPPAAVAAIREFGLEDDLHKHPGELPYGRRRLVAVARAVAVEPSILLLDEPAAGLDEHETLELVQLIRRLADGWGIAVLVVEHDMDFVMSLCDRVTVLDFGRLIAEGTTAEVASDPAVIAAYLGGTADEEQPGTLVPIATQNGATPGGHVAETQETPA